MLKTLESRVFFAALNCGKVTVEMVIHAGGNAHEMEDNEGGAGDDDSSDEDDTTTDLIFDVAAAAAMIRAAQENRAENRAAQENLVKRLSIAARTIVTEREESSE